MADPVSFILPDGSTSRAQTPDIETDPPTPHSFVPLLRLLTTSPESFTLSHLREAFRHLATEAGCTEVQVAAFLTALKVSALDRQGDVVATCAEVLRAKAIALDLRSPGIVAENEWICDIVGTGGDGKDTFNVSTSAAIVAAGAGCRVCKHGNRASSSASGAADLLVSVGVPITKVPPESMLKISQTSRFIFLFAPLYHPSMAYVGPVRKSLGFPTVFNILGPLINPSSPDAMVVGVHSEYLGQIFAEALLLLGMKRAWVVCGSEGLDEISPECPTHVWDLHNGAIIRKSVTPEDFGLRRHSLSSVRGGTASDNAATLVSLLKGEVALDSPIETFVVLNAAAVLYVSGQATGLRDAVSKARESISTGNALGVLEVLGSAAREEVSRLGL